ncbi:MAG: site-2 protease family protein [Thaumarchaeota archaeon]|nr:site-2 protease family protein [Nitrososphaerota archaeon]
MQDEYRSVSFKYGVLMLRTRRLLGVLDKLGTYRITKPLAWFMLYIMPVAAVAAFILLLGPIAILFSSQGPGLAQYIRSLTPLANLLLPGVNPYVPIVYGWIALIIGMVVHEASHGIVARSLGMPVKSAGLLFFLIVPIGAFVEVDDKVLKEARARDSGRVLAAGSGINLIVAVAALLLMIVAVSTMVPATNGAGVSVVYTTPQGPTAAAAAGVSPGDFLLKMDNKPYLQAINDTAVYKPGNVVNVTIYRNGHTFTISNVTLGSRSFLDTRTNQTFTVAFFGVGVITSEGLQSTVSNYLQAFTRSPAPYVCIPTLPRCQDYVPFSDPLVGFYTSSLGPALPVVVNLLFWIYFVNFNLAIFNSLPIFPMDGGQAFEIGLRALGRGKFSDELTSRVMALVTLSLVALLLIIIVGPYLFFR